VTARELLGLLPSAGPHGRQGAVRPGGEQGCREDSSPRASSDETNLDGIHTVQRATALDAPPSGIDVLVSATVGEDRGAKTVKVFLSYRRDDTGGRAGRLYDAFVTRFGNRNVFQDVNAVAPGLDFTAQLDTAIAQSDVVLVVIGRDWLGGPDQDGIRRIDRPDDFVRLEVSKALAADIRVVPVLVDAASLPPPDELPDDVSSLAHRQAVTVRDVSWHADVDELIRRLAVIGSVRSRNRHTGRPLATS
jgi:hypothetical protein